MIGFVPWMIISIAVILVVAAWGYTRGTLGRVVPPDLERLPEAERAFAECMEERGVRPPRLAIYRDPDGDGLVIVGPDELDDRTRAVLGDCDGLLAPRFARD